MPDDLLDRRCTPSPNERQARPRRRPPTGPRVGAGSVLLGVALAGVLIAYDCGAPGGPRRSPGWAVRQRPRVAPAAASTAVEPATGVPARPGQTRGSQRQHRLPDHPPARSLAVVTRAGPAAGRSKPGWATTRLSWSAPAPGTRMLRRGRPVKADTYELVPGPGLPGGRSPCSDGSPRARTARLDPPRPLSCQPQPTSTPWPRCCRSSSWPASAIATHLRGRRAPRCRAGGREACALAGGEGVCVEASGLAAAQTRECSRRRWTRSGSTRQSGANVRPADGPCSPAWTQPAPCG